MQNQTNHIARSSCRARIGLSHAEAGWVMNGAFGLLGSFLLFGSVCAQEKCPVEVKLLLSSPEPQPVIAALAFKKKTESQIYFFDTESFRGYTPVSLNRITQGAQKGI
jgi:hypothetical protein